MKKYCKINNIQSTLILFLILIPYLVNAQSNDSFLKYEFEKLDYYTTFRGKEYKERILQDKKEAEKENDSIIYDTHILLKSFCDTDFYRFNILGSHSFYHIAMIDNKKNTIAFLDTLLLSQTLDSITDVLKNCEQQTSPKKIFDFYNKIESIYKYNKSVGINLRGSYSSPSQAVVCLLSAENALDFDKAKRYIDFEKVYNSQEEWEQKVKANPPKLDFYNYWFTVKENGRDAIVDTKYNDECIRYFLRQCNRSPYEWKVVRIESD